MPKNKIKKKTKQNSRALGVAEEVGRLTAAGLLEGLKFLPQHQYDTHLHYTTFTLKNTAQNAKQKYTVSQNMWEISQI